MAVLAADDQQRWRTDLREPWPGEIGATAARDHRRDPDAQLGGGEKRRAGAGARSEEAQRQVRDVRLATDPERRLRDAFGEQGDVEDVAAVVGLVRVSRSSRSVANPLAFSASATAMFRGLRRLEPLPCAKRMMPRGSDGTRRSPASPNGGSAGRWKRPPQRRPSLRPDLAEQPDRLLVGQLVEIIIEAAHAAEAAFGAEADDRVGLASMSASASAGATGMAMTTLAAPSLRIAIRAAFIVAPVARPSSTTIAVRPVGSTWRRQPRYLRGGARVRPARGRGRAPARRHRLRTGGGHPH